MSLLFEILDWAALIITIISPILMAIIVEKKTLFDNKGRHTKAGNVFIGLAIAAAIAGVYVGINNNRNARDFTTTVKELKDSVGKVSERLDKSTSNFVQLQDEAKTNGLRWDSISGKLVSMESSIKETNKPLSPVIEKPVIDLCKWGIEMKKHDDTTFSFSIPYCAEKNAVAYNVKLRAVVLLNEGTSFSLLKQDKDEWSSNVIITSERGKAISLTVTIAERELKSLYFYVKGRYSNRDQTFHSNVSDIFKWSEADNMWIQPVGAEDGNIRKFLRVKNEL